MSKLSKHFKSKQLIGKEKDHDLFTLDCGLQVVYKKVKNSSISHCGITINVGSKDDGKKLGLAHFVEHMLFKGTKKKTAKQILNKIENVGGEINAFTGRQCTCIYTSTLHQFVPRSIDVLFDIFNNSVFPKDEIEKERQVIIDEISMYLDSAEDVIFDEYYAQHFKNHVYGNSILGTKKSVKSIKEKQLNRFYKHFFTPENAVFSYVGSVSKEKIKKKLNEAFKGYIKSEQLPNKEPFFVPGSKVFSKKIKEDFNQGYKIIGFPAYHYEHKDRLILALLANILGGPSLNSILNMKIREEKGLTYQIEASYSAYKQSGLFTIYFCTEKKNIEFTTKLVLKEIEKLKKNGISRLKLNIAKQQFIGQSIMAEENNSNLMMHLGKEQVLYNRIGSVNKFLNALEKMQPSDIQRVAKKIFSNSRRSELNI